MGDERPIEFPLELQRLAAEATVDDFLKRIFLRSVLSSIKTSNSCSRKVKFEALAEAADDAWMTVAATAAEAPATVSAVSIPACRGGRGGRQGNQRPGKMRNMTLCQFYQKFGDAAKKCVQGCTRWTETRPRDATPARVFHVEEDLDWEESIPPEDTAPGNA